MMNSPIFTIWISIFLFFCACNDKQRNDDGQRQTAPVSDPAKIALAYPDSALAQEQLIQYYRDSGEYEKAMRHAELMSEKDSLNPRWPYIHATLAYEYGDTANAIGILERSMSLSPDRPSVIFLGTLYARTGDQRAIMIAGLLRTKPLNAASEAGFISGTYLSMKGEKTKAIEEFDNAIRESYTFMEAYREKALLLIEQGKYAEALSVMDKAVTIKNNYAEGHYYKGVCLGKLGRKGEAAESFQMALLYDPSYEEAASALEALK